MRPGTHRWAGLWLSRCLHLAVLLLQLLDLLQGEEGAAAAGRLLGVPLRPLLEGVGVAALHVQAQVLLVLGGEVAELTSKRLPSCRAREGESGRRSQGDRRESRQTLTVSGRMGVQGISQTGSLTCVLDCHVRDQEVLPEGGILADAALVGLVIHVRQLVVQQDLLVLADIVTEFTLEPARTKPPVTLAEGEKDTGSAQAWAPTCGWQWPGCVSAGAS